MNQPPALGHYRPHWRRSTTSSNPDSGRSSNPRRQYLAGAERRRPPRRGTPTSGGRVRVGDVHPADRVLPGERLKDLTSQLGYPLAVPWRQRGRPLPECRVILTHRQKTVGVVVLVG